LAKNNKARKRRPDPKKDAARFREAEGLRETGALKDAVGAYRALLSESPRHVAAMRGLAAALGGLGRAKQAERAARKAAETESEDLCNMAEAAADYARYAQADKLYKQAHAIDPEGLEPVWGLAEVAYARNRMDDARIWYSKFLELDPGNAEAEHQLAAVGGAAVPDRAGDEYVVSHFDRFADNFDTNLVKELNYVGPQLLDGMVSGALGKKTKLGDVLDLGCGTGLSGMPFRKRAKRLDGVDLSPEMVAKAKKRKLYDKLYVAEVAGWLADAKRRYDLVVAADLLVYFGDVAPVFEGATKVLNTGGYLACATEWQKKKGYSLTPSGRYTHGVDAIRAVAKACGLQELDSRNERLRDEYGKPVMGTVWLFRKP
jgi:predicted TPR repeat methyltransferase